nr:2-oxo acid dehydrogenase subunit E2 [Acidobacteriota bacterium]
MIKEFKLPDLGEGLTESEILDWKVSVGDSVTLNQTIAEVETAKAVVELPSPYAGVVTAIHFAPGATVEVGVPIIAFDLGDTGASASGEADAAEPAAQRVPTLVGYGAEVEKGGRPTRRARISTRSSHGANPVVEPVETRPAELGLPQAPSTERPRSTPPVRKLAKDLGVDLTMLTGTGVGGLIVRD